MATITNPPVTEFAADLPFTSDTSTATRWLMSHLRRHWPLLLVMFIGAFGNAALAAALPVLTGLAFDAALATPANLTAIGWAAIAIMVSQLVRAVLQLGRNFSSSVIGERLERDMRQELYVSLLASR
jgi:ATP-binding cassette subfamily B protein